MVPFQECINSQNTYINYKVETDPPRIVLNGVKYSPYKWQKIY